MTNAEQLLLNIKTSTKAVGMKVTYSFGAYIITSMPKNNSAEAYANSKAFCPRRRDFSYWCGLEYR